MSKKRILYRYIFVFIFAVIPLCFLPKAFNKLQIQSYLEEQDVFDNVVIKSSVIPFQNLHLIRRENEDELYAFIPAEIANSDFTVCFEKEREGIILSDDESDVEITDGSTHNYSIYVQDKKYASIRVHFLFAQNLPTMYINTESGSMDKIHEDKTNKEKSTYAIYKADGSVDSSGECSVKGRGNSSWVGGQDGKGQKKPYNISLKHTDSLLEMGEQKKWCLLASYDDQSFLRNKITFEAAERFGCEFTPQAEYVNLYTNGEYKGLYLLTQRIDMDDGCIKDKNGYLLEFDVRCYDVENWFITKKNQKIAIKYPQDISSEDEEYISSYMINVEDNIYGADIDTKMLSNVVDLESWTKMYVIHDFFVNWDTSYSSFFVYKFGEDDKIYAGPVWDFDLSMGMSANGEMYDVLDQVMWMESNPENFWLNGLAQNKAIKKHIEDIYLNDFLKIIDDIQKESLPKWIEYIRVSADMDAVLWNDGRGDFDRMSSDLDKWLYNRIVFEKEYLSDSSKYVKEIKDDGNGRKLIYCNKK